MVSAVEVLDADVEVLERADEVDGEIVVLGVSEDDLECTDQCLLTFKLASPRQREALEKNLT